MSANRLKELEKEISRLKKLAYRDELTGLYNRHGFRDEAKKFVSAVIAPRGGVRRRKSFLVKNFALVVFDIDDFKKINDRYGHLAGDAALKHLSRLILKMVRDVDIVARWGGEEIIVGLIGASEQDAFGVAEKIREKAERGKFGYSHPRFRLTVSGGVADLTRIDDFTTLFNVADKALYHAKKLGKNRIVRYSSL